LTEKDQEPLILLEKKREEVEEKRGKRIKMGDGREVLKAVIHTRYQTIMLKEKAGHLS